MKQQDSSALPYLHLHLSALPEEFDWDEPLQLGGHRVRIVRLKGSSDRPSISCSFEQVMERLSALARMFAEPDGSFVWRGGDPQDEWQMDGMIYDHLGRIQWIEIKGSCPRREWHQLLSCFDWPRQALILYFVDHQRFCLVEELDILWSKNAS